MKDNEIDEKIDKIISILNIIKGWIVFIGVITILSIFTWLVITFHVANDINKIKKQDSWQERLKTN